MSTASPRLLPREPLHVAVLALCVVGVCLHQSWLWTWYIEDAAISYAYGRNLVVGEGLVPYPGGERVEGFSNPTWVALIALFELVGVDGFTSTKWLGLLFGAACVPFTYALTRRALPEDRRHYALIAPMLLASTSMFAIWSTSGLENALVSFLIVGGAWRLSLEMEEGGRPWSAVWFLLVALSRPDGLLYAAVAGLLLLIATVRARRSLAPIGGWLAILWVPYLAMIGLRLWYFAWPLPMTYYGKVGGGGTMIHRWYGWGWVQLRLYCAELGQVVFLPIQLVGLTGLRGWRGRVVVAAILAMTVHLLIPGPDWLRAMPFWPELPEPEWWLRARIAAVGILALLLPGIAVGTPRWEPRVAASAMAIVTVFFHLYSNADWMIGFRWMSFLAATAAVPFTVGLVELGAWLHRKVADAVPHPDRLIAPICAVVLVAWAVPNLRYTSWYWEEGKSEEPFMVQRRATYSLNLWRRINMHHRPMVVLDHDMGGHLYWFGDTHKMVDVAALIDVPRAMHNYGQPAFVDEYLLREERPDVVYLSKNWQGWTGLPKRELFQQGWVHVPPRNGPWDEKTSFWLRRDLLTAPRWEHPIDRKVNFAGGASLQGWDLPTGAIGRGRAFYLEVGAKTSPRKPGEAYRMIAFLTRGARAVATWELPLGHGILPMHAWRPDEVFVGRFALELPGHVEEGTYDLGFVVLGPSGQVMPAGGYRGEAYVAPTATVYPSPEIGAEPAFARGEVRFAGAVRVVSAERNDALADERREEAIRRAGEGACEEADALWLLAQRQVPKNHAWQEQQRPVVGRAFARCWARKAGHEPEHEVEHLARAHGWDHREPTYLAAVEPVADRLYAEGLAAREAEAWETAYARFDEVLRIAPTRSWARRYAEEARDRRLGYESLSVLGRLRRRPPKPTEPAKTADAPKPREE